MAERLARVVSAAAARRDELAEQRATTSEELDRVKEQVRALQGQLASITDAVHRDEVARAQAALRIEQLEATILEQHGIGLEDLIADYGPDVTLPPTDLEMSEY